MQSDDPPDVGVLVVTADDVVTALEANRRDDAGALLRVTPPFAGRMRARLHLAGRENSSDEPAPLHVDPAVLVGDVPSFPSPDDTEDDLRSHPAVETSAGPHEVAVRTLG